MEEVQATHVSGDGVLCDYCDGSYVQSHPMFQKSHETLLLSFYFDELEVANPLGSKRGKGKHKLGINPKAALSMSKLYFQPSRCVLLDASQYSSCLSLNASFHTTSCCSKIINFMDVLLPSLVIHQLLH